MSKDEGNLALLIEQVMKAATTYLLLEEMATDLIRINPAAAETAALAMVRVKRRMARVSRDLGALILG